MEGNERGKKIQQKKKGHKWDAKKDPRLCYFWDEEGFRRARNAAVWHQLSLSSEGSEENKKKEKSIVSQLCSRNHHSALKKKKPILLAVWSSLDFSIGALSNLFLKKEKKKTRQTSIQNSFPDTFTASFFSSSFDDDA